MKDVGLFATSFQVKVRHPLQPEAVTENPAWPATTVDAAERDVREIEGGSGVETSDARAEETARTVRRGEEGSLRRVFFFFGRPEGVGAAVGVAAVAGERRRYLGSVAKAAAAN